MERHRMENEPRKKLYEFIRSRRLAVIATTSKDGAPEAALINIAVTQDLEIIFETTTATRKLANLRANSQVAIVIGWEASQTLQCDGFADEPQASELERLKAYYLSVFPEKVSHQDWPGNCYFRIQPSWARLSDYYRPRLIEEYRLAPDQNASARPRSNWRQSILAGVSSPSWRWIKRAD
jgi:hypothetical protein